MSQQAALLTILLALMAPAPTEAAIRLPLRQCEELNCRMAPIGQEKDGGPVGEFLVRRGECLVVRMLGLGSLIGGTWHYDEAILVPPDPEEGYFVLPQGYAVDWTDVPGSIRVGPANDSAVYTFVILAPNPNRFVYYGARYPSGNPNCDNPTPRRMPDHQH